MKMRMFAASLATFVLTHLAGSGLHAQTPLRINDPAVKQASHSEYAPHPDTPEGARKRPLKSLLGMSCYSHHTQFGCGTFHSEMGFIFGSCRYFFGDPCVPKPPHSGHGIFGRRDSAGDCCR